MPRSKAKLEAELLTKLETIASLNSSGHWALKTSLTFQPNREQHRRHLRVLLLIQEHLNQHCTREDLCVALSKLPPQEQEKNISIITLASEVIEWRALNADHRDQLETKLHQELAIISQIDDQGNYAAPRKEKYRHTWEVLKTTLRYLTQDNCYFEELIFTQQTLFKNYSRSLSTRESTDALIKDVIDITGIKELNYERLGLNCNKLTATFR